MNVQSHDLPDAATTTNGFPTAIDRSLRSGKGETGAESNSPPPPAGRPVNILLVDDETRNLEVLESILASPEYELIRALSADEALLAVLQMEFAAIVLDIQMPGINGFELARLIKQRKRSQHIPIIFLTAYFQEDQDVMTGYGSGAVDYLTKPVNSQILKSKVGVFADLFRTTRALTEANVILENEIAERRKAELANAQLAAIVESSSDAILGRTLDGTITSWNKGAERIFGYPASEVVGRSIATLIPLEHADELDAIHERIRNGESIAPFETVRRSKDGRRIPVSLALSPIHDAEGHVTGVSAIMRDIRERKRLEAQILEASEREQRRIAEDLHDGLGQHLAGISCLSDALGKDLAAAKASNAPHAFSISRLLNDAVAQTRSLSRGLYPVVPEPNGLMSGLLALATNVTQLFKVACEFTCPQPVLFEDNAVATHLYRIAQEAVSNAIKHGRARRVEITLVAEPSQTVLTISDNGRGLTNLSNASTGLGMRIMKYRTAMLGGQFIVRNRAGGGTEAVCTVPDKTSTLPD